MHALAVIWALGFLSSLLLTGYMTGKDAIVSQFQSKYNNYQPLGLQALWLAVVFPVHFIHLYVWHTKAEEYGVRGPFEWFTKPRSEASK